MRRTVFVVITLSALGGITSLHQISRATPQAATVRTKWEYNTLTKTALDRARGLSQLGEEGWELVAVEGESREASRVADFKFGGNVSNIRVREQTFYFKRPK